MSTLGLAQDYRFALFNQTVITISNFPNSGPTVVGRRVRFDTNGSLSYETAHVSFFSISSLSGGANIGSNSYVPGSSFSNTASMWLGGEFVFSAGTVSNASGNLTLYLEFSTDGGSTWPIPASANGAGGGMVIAVLGFASTTTASTASTNRNVIFEL